MGGGGEGSPEGARQRTLIKCLFCCCTLDMLCQHYLI